MTAAAAPPGAALPDCLLGCTGFVGQALLRARSFEGRFNSANIADLPGGSYATLVCAAAPAAMWAANACPAADKQNLRRIAAAVKQVSARRVVLVSTIAVFDDAAAGYTESTACYETAKAYGRHRRELETELAAQVECLHVIRLPALFGQGLKKNFIFDLLNPIPSFLRADAFDRAVAALRAEALDALRSYYRYRSDLAMWELDRAGLGHGGARGALEQALEELGLAARNFTNSASRFQFYNIDRLAADIDWAIAQNIPVLNICSEPLAADELCHALTGSEFAAGAAPVYREDMRSDHGARFGHAAPYLYSREAVLDELQTFSTAAKP